jgi:hypothetical protein
MLAKNGTFETLFVKKLKYFDTKLRNYSSFEEKSLFPGTKKCCEHDKGQPIRELSINGYSKLRCGQKFQA